MVYMKKIIKWIWTLPQNCLGWLLYHCIKGDVLHYKKAIVKCWNLQSGSMAMGKYIFLCPNHVDNERMIKHEYGHVLQSELLGCLYLLVIGIPSIIWAWCFENYRNKHHIGYFSFYTEQWADYLGGVNKSQEN